jgi:malonate-semialdehyde dehydrogenase (acetylating)/methylmalonate-semialdehyde dehydrogenase
LQRVVHVGRIGVNVPIPLPPLRRLEGLLFGHNHIYGEEGGSSYTRTKVVTQR